MTEKRKRRQSRVPTTRLGRVLRLGMTAGGLAAGGVAEGIRRLAGTGEVGQTSALLTSANANRLARRLSHLRGAAMKLGQLLSLESEQVLPTEFAEALAILRDSADTMPVSQLNRLMGREFGKGWQARFQKFDYEPVAAASIGQVHRVVTSDGRELALKVQYPGVAKSIGSDVNNLATMLRVSRILPMELDITGITAEARRQLQQEADYLQEAAHLERFGKLVADEPRFRVPKVHRDLTTRRVLAMDYMHGEPLVTLGEPGTSQSRRDRVGGLLYHLLFRELFEFGVMQTDPNFGNYLVDPDSGELDLLDFGSAMEYARDFTERYARICRAMLDDDIEGVEDIATEIGYIHPDDTDEHARQIVNLILMICEPLRCRGAYDFAASDLTARARDAGIDLVFKSGHFRAPPPETIFLHRKLVGSFLLCARIRARVNVRPLIEPFLA
jgi:predicted unusual protein kinase regulating ubiquinone biosynthesis (AarF/ABC1/UbiB family)